MSAEQPTPAHTSRSGSSDGAPHQETAGQGPFGSATAASVPQALVPGDPRSVGGYRVVARLGEGGMGTVYLGEAPGGARGAIKVIRPELAADPGFRGRFADEVTNARKVAAFCTARVLDHGESDGRPYLITEFIAGRSLDDYIDRHGPLPAGPLNALAVGVANALAAIHAARLVHRDLKPANVLLAPDGPKVIDFGIARALDSTTRHTRTGFFVGTPGWVAPEQVFGAEITTAADVFTWGVLISYAATGRHPYGQGHLMLLAQRAERGEFDAEFDLERIPGDLRSLISAALDPDPMRRPTADVLLTSLIGEVADPQGATGRVVTRAWTPGQLPAAFFAPPPAFTPPPFAVPPPPAPPPPYSTQPQGPGAAGPAYHPGGGIPPMHGAPHPPHPPHVVRPSGAGRAVPFVVGAVLLLGILVTASVLVVLRLTRDSPPPQVHATPPPSLTQIRPSAGNPAGGGTVTSLAGLCRKLDPSVPARARSLRLEDKNSTPTLQLCGWSAIDTTRAIDLDITVTSHSSGSDGSAADEAHDKYQQNWENIGDPEYHHGRAPVSGLGEEGGASQLVSEIIKGPNERNTKTYWMGGAAVVARVRNVTIEIDWEAANYPASARGGQVLRGEQIPYAQARREAIAMARAVIRALPTS